MQISHTVSFRFLNTAAQQILLNNFDKLAELLLETYVVYFRVLKETFEI